MRSLPVVAPERTFAVYVGAAEAPRVLVLIEGVGQIEHNGATYAVGRGEVWLLPAVVGVCAFQPQGRVNLLEIALPVAGK